jgi:hypothetical protein
LTTTAAWLTRLVGDERKRDDARLQVTNAAARKADLVREHGQRLIDELRTTVERDIESFRREFPGDETRAVLLETVQPGGGFVASKPASAPTVVLSVVPRVEVAAVNCEYRFTTANGLPPREDRFELMFASDGVAGGLVFKHLGTGQTFTNADALSEFLLVPLFLGRSR